MLWDEPKIFFLERRYFFSIILSEFLKNRVALQETKEFRLCPIFDNGLSLLSDLNDYPLTDDLYTCIERVQAKPFDSDHVEQVTAAEQLYGRQLTFRISHEELRSELNLLSEAYSPDILQRAERVLLEQKRKHSWLF